MNTNKITVQAEFAEEARFECQPAPAFRATHENEFERLKANLLANRQRKDGTKWEEPLRDAANEAAALAWTTTVPLLVFPALFEEKAAAAAVQDRRQARILQKSRELLAA